jgi:hypothetical protein
LPKKKGRREKGEKRGREKERERDGESCIAILVLVLDITQHGCHGTLVCPVSHRGLPRLREKIQIPPLTGR